MARRRRSPNAPLTKVRATAASVHSSAGAPSAGSAARTPVRIRGAVPEDRVVLATLRRQAEQVHARLLPDYFRVSPDRELGSRTTNVAGAATVTLVAEPSRPGVPVRPGQPHHDPDQDQRQDGARLAPQDDRVLGYVTVKVVDTPRDPAMTPRRRAYVETVVVDERHRGGGIGTALMRAAAEWARRRQASELVLTVWSDNTAAEALYRRLGYHPLARVLRQRLDPG